MLCSFTCLHMNVCIFNPEHDLCLAAGRANYVPPRSAVQFALRDAAVMQPLYPDARCVSVYDTALPDLLRQCNIISVWGWNAVLKRELLKRGASETLLPTDAEIACIRELQHRATILPLQPDCHAVHDITEMETLLRERGHWVMKAPWSGAGRGLRWVHGSLTAIDRHWIEKTVRQQRCVIAEPIRDVVADVALEYRDGVFFGYSYFRTGSGVYKDNLPWTDGRIASAFPLTDVKARVETWIDANVTPHYHGPLGVDLMVCGDGSVHVAEVNFRHTMGMVAHERFQTINR